MEFGGASSLVLALAVALWLAYFVPSWIRRRNYLATERNAVRLQQALRVLAETSELPASVRLEDAAKTRADLDRRLKRARLEAERAERELEEAAERSLPVVPRPRNDEDRRRAKQATRRGRLLTTTLIAGGLVGAGFGVRLGVADSTWWLLVASVVVVLFGFAMLQRLARVANAQRFAAERAERARDTGAGADRAAAAAAAAAAAPAFDVSAFSFDLAERAAADEAQDAAPSEREGWTPVAVPKPLYLTRATAPEAEREAAIAGRGAEEGASTGEDPDGPDGGPAGRATAFDDLREASRRSEQAIRDAHRASGVIPFGRRDAGRSGSGAFAGDDPGDERHRARVERARMLDAIVIDELAAGAAPAAVAPSGTAASGTLSAAIAATSRKVNGPRDAASERRAAEEDARATRAADARAAAVSGGSAADAGAEDAGAAAATATPPAPHDPASPWARMGVLDDVEAGLGDLDGILRRRRAG